MRTILITVGVAVILILVIAALSYVPGFSLSTPNDLNPAANHIKRRGMICTRDKELVFVEKKICIYVCADGEKARVDGIEKCLKEIEL